MDLFWSFLWGVWLRRNAWVFEQKRISVEDMARKAVSFVVEYKDSMESDPKLVQEGIPRRNVWRKPDAGSYKLNTDATIFPDGKVGFGSIMRDEDGDIIMATSNIQEGVFEVDEAEALAARHAVILAMESGMRNFELESDCLKLISHLKKGTKENSSFGNIVFDILELNKRGSNISFSHVCRKGNQVAHNLAHNSRKYGELRVWLEEGPADILSYVQNDLILNEV